jgi:nucleoid-associated protein YgaU
MVTAKAIQPPSPNGATLGAPAVLPVKTMASPSAPAPTAKDVIATAQPIKATSPTEPSDSAAGISQASPVRGGALPTEQSAEADSAPKPDEYLPLSNHHREYVPLGPGRPNEEFVSVAGGSLPKGEVAYGGTSVVSHVRKTDLTGDQPKVISYDAKAYLTLEGDSFEQIAETMYHTSGYGEALARYNRSRFRGDDVLPTGAKVRVPPMEVLGQQRGMASTGTARDAFQKVDRMPYVMSNAPAGAGVAIPISNHPPIQQSAFDHQLVGTPAPEHPGNQYRAERNETLWAIAKRHLGDGRRWREIYNLNRDRLTSETQVPAGTTLRMPTTTP